MTEEQDDEKIEALDQSAGAPEVKLLRLQDVTDWHSDVLCSGTALAAISGKRLDEISDALVRAAKERDVDISPSLNQSHNVNDWLNAVKILGMTHYVGDNFSDLNFNQRPTLDDWMSHCEFCELQLVFCDNGGDIATGTGHVFAVEKGYVVDTYTHGRRVKFTELPADLRIFRVKFTFMID